MCFMGALCSDAASCAIGPVIPVKAGIQGFSEIRRGGVDLDRAPQAAVDLLLDAHRPPSDDHRALHRRGWRRR